MKNKINKVVLAYSGGLDTSVILKWLIETYGCEVVAFSADLGQPEPMGNVEQNALKTGAVKAYVDDLKETFVKDYVFPMFRANAIYEGQYLLGTSIARPLIAKRQMEIAELEGADAVSHGATGKGNDQVRFELAYLAMNPHIKIVAPWREWDLNSRTALMDFAAKHSIAVPTTHAKPYSTDGNMLHISYEGGILEDPWAAPPDDIFQLTVGIEQAPDTPEIIEVGFDGGNPVTIDGKALSPAVMLAELNRLGGKHGIGRVDLVENRYVGMKSRGVYETPGGTILRQAHMAMESITLDREVMHLRDGLIPKYAELVYNGFWFSPERELLQTLVDETQKRVTGTVRLKLCKGNCMVQGRKSDYSLYSEAHATFEDDNVYSQKDAEGFIRLNALRMRIRKADGEIGGAMSGKPWDGRFAERTDSSVEAFTSSIDVDRRLYPYDIAGSIAHSKMLAKVGVLTSQEADLLVEGLGRIQRDLDHGTFEFDDSLEDIHMHIEARLLQDVGKVAQKLHTARSRNDQVALDVRMFVRDATRGIIDLLVNLQKVLIDMAGRHIDVIMPGYTHVQRAQPVLLSHHWMAYCEMFARDTDRFTDSLVRTDVMPLGAAALAGTTYPIDRAYTAELLGVLTDIGQQHGCRGRPGLRHRIHRRRRHLHGPSEPHFRGTGALVVVGIRIHQHARCLCHGQQHHAPEEESRCVRTGPGQDRLCIWRSHGCIDHDEGPAHDLQPGHAGRQGPPVQDHGHPSGLSGHLRANATPDRGRCRPHAAGGLQRLPQRHRHGRLPGG